MALGLGLSGAGCNAIFGIEPGERPAECGTGAYCAAPQVIALAAHLAHTCALLQGGVVKCWGMNANGELGLGDNLARGDEPGEMGNALPAVELGEGAEALSVAVGNAYSCALLNDGSVKCWGRNELGQLGLGHTDDRGDEPGEMGSALLAVELGEGAHAIAIAAGELHTCALLSSGDVKCWGSNDYGQLGLGDTDARGDGEHEMGDNLPPVEVDSSGTAIAIAAGSYHTCALLMGGEVKCWGDNSYGQLGLGDTDARGDHEGEMGGGLSTVDLGAGNTATAFVAGGDHTCALLIGGAVACWGGNSSGELGLGDQENRMNGATAAGQPVTVDLGTGKQASEITAGLSHTCARLEGGEIKCWGDNAYGQLGLSDTLTRGDEPGEMGDALPAVELAGGLQARNVVAGDGYTCALLSDGSVQCWGFNDVGQLGLGDTNPRGDEPGEMGDALPRVKLSSDAQ